MIDAIQFRGEYEAANGKMYQYTAYFPLDEMRGLNVSNSLAFIRTRFDELFAQEVVKSGFLYGSRIYEREARLASYGADHQLNRFQPDGDWLDDEVKKMMQSPMELFAEAYALSYADFRRAKRHTERDNTYEPEG
jgi:hypothetical protein